MTAALGLALALVLALPTTARAEKNAWAGWCQCAVFVVNNLGLEIIPGEYYTAGSFVVPNERGRTWMEYQGFSLRPPGENPRSGDVVVIRPNGRVFIPESGEGSQFMEVNAAWTGHIGVVESVEAKTIEGIDTWRLTFLSSNWGVNAGPMFVRSNCFNVDRSVVWIEKTDPDFSFWLQTDPQLQRRHILNIGRQLANGYYHVGIDGKVDGYPLTGDGLTAYMWNVAIPPDGALDEALAANRAEVSAASALPGDALVVKAAPGNFFHGIYAGGSGMWGDWYENGSAYWFDAASGTLKGPDLLSSLLAADLVDQVHVYRSISIVPDLMVYDFEIREGNDNAMMAAYVLKNQGGQELKIGAATLRVSSPQGNVPAGTDVTPAVNIEIPAGQEFVYISPVEVADSGVYLILPVVNIPGETMYFPEMGEVRHLTAHRK
jgi:hypothetical protein